METRRFAAPDGTQVAVPQCPSLHVRSLKGDVMSLRFGLTREMAAAGLLVALALEVCAHAQNGQQPAPQSPHDSVANAQIPSQVPMERPEQRKTPHDLSDIFAPAKAVPSSDALSNQPEHGGMNGFDFYRDPLGALKPGLDFEDIYKAGVAAKPEVTARQRKLLESRYNLEPRLDQTVKMSRGKPVVVGPTARLPEGTDWDALGAMSPADIRQKNIFPYKTLPHPAQGGGLGGQVFPQVQIKMFPRLERYDVEFDLPEAFLPEFPPAIFPPESARAGGRFAGRGGLDQ